MPKDIPGPGKYYPIQFTEASHRFTFPRAGIEGQEGIKATHVPGPQTYFQQQQDPRNLSAAMHNAKSMLGGAIDKVVKQTDD